LFDSLEAHFHRHRAAYLWTFVGLAVVLGLTQFNYKVSEANDDSMYLEDAFNFSRDFFGYYTANAPFYSMFLSLFVRLAGFDLVVLKGTGFLFMVLHLYFLYRAFEKRIPYLVLFFVLYFTAVNHYMLYYASITFAEQFFLMQQGLFFWLFFRAWDGIDKPQGFGRMVLHWLPAGLCLFVLTMSRNVAIGIVFPVMAFLLFRKRFLHTAAFATAFLAFRMPFELLRKVIWGEQNQYANQVTKLIRWKDPYDPGKGMEDFAGFVDRFTGNYGLYVCKRFYQIMGFLGENDYVIRPGLGFIFFVLMAVGVAYLIRRKNDVLWFVFLYAGALTGITFIVMQTRWDQLRFILVFVPLILVFFLSVFYYLTRKKGGGLQGLYLSIVVLLTVSVTVSSLRQSAANLPVVRENLKGNAFYGYTPDWQNYLLMSRWCADSLPATAYVACRKAPMSFIYGGGKRFFPVYQADQNDPDSVMALFEREKVTHFILASLRRNPGRNDGYIINTVHRLVQPAVQKYPDRFSLVKKIGETEPAYLYEIRPAQGGGTRRERN